MYVPEDGWCRNCGGTIFGENGISVEDAGKRLITGCPHCNYSFVE